MVLLTDICLILLQLKHKSKYIPIMKDKYNYFSIKEYKKSFLFYVRFVMNSMSKICLV